MGKGGRFTSKQRLFLLNAAVKRVGSVHARPDLSLISLSSRWNSLPHSQAGNWLVFLFCLNGFQPRLTFWTLFDLPSSKLIHPLAAYQVLLLLFESNTFFPSSVHPPLSQSFSGCLMGLKSVCVFGLLGLFFLL